MSWLALTSNAISKTTLTTKIGHLRSRWDKGSAKKPCIRFRMKVLVQEEYISRGAISALMSSLTQSGSAAFLRWI